MNKTRTSDVTEQNSDNETNIQPEEKKIKASTSQQNKENDDLLNNNIADALKNFGIEQNSETENMTKLFGE